MPVPSEAELYARGAARTREDAARMLKDEPHIVAFFYEHWYGGELENPRDVAVEGEW